ncbi:MAG: (2Fe-2S)-binding protein, partial [Acidimicrobiaceae bacterium]
MNPNSEIYSLRVNGKTHEIRDSWVGESLLYVLRERLNLPGTKGACEQGECGSCTVIMDGQAVCSCLVMAATAIETEIQTVENLSAVNSLTDVQDAFVSEGGVQCGFCTPGLVVAIE